MMDSNIRDEQFCQDGEEKLLHIWQEIFQKNNIDVNSNFFALGGNSLVAMCLVAKAQQANISISFEDLFTYPTVKTLYEFFSTKKAKKRDLEIKNNDFETFSTLQGLNLKDLKQDEKAEASFGLSPFQQSIYVDMLSVDYEGLYTVQTELIINQPIVEESLYQAWEEMVDRYDILRTIFVFDENSHALRQKVLCDKKFLWQVDNIASLHKKQMKEKIREIKNKAKLDITKLNQLPNIKINLVYIIDNSVLLILTQNHLTTDGYSIVKLFEEVFRTYDSYLKKENLNKARYGSYKNYVEWIDKKLNHYSDEQKLFWKNYLIGFNVDVGSFSSLNFFHHTNKEVEFKRIKLTFGEHDSQCMTEWLSSNNMTLSILARAAWGTLLSRYCQTNDIVFGFVFSNYPPSFFSEPFLGPCINMVPCRVQLDQSETGLKLLSRIKQEGYDLYKNSIYPLFQIKKECGYNSGNKLFDTVLIVENYTNKPTLNIQYESFDIYDETSFPLVIQILPNQDITLEAIYRSDLMQPDFVQEILENFKHILKQFYLAPANKTDHYELFTPEKKSYYVKELSSGDKIQIGNYTVIDYLYQLPKELYSKKAIIHKEHEITYQTFFNRINLLTNFLASLEIRKGEIVAIYTTRSIEMVIAIYATLQIGAAYLPVDPAYPEARVDYMISNSQVKVVLSNLPNKLINNKNILWIDLKNLNFMDKGKQATILPDSQSLAYVIYTSGSTGQPKGVMISHQALSNLLIFMKKECDFSANDIVLNLASYAFDLSVPDLFLPLINGGTLVLLDQEDIYHPTLLTDIIRKNQVSFIQATPSNWQLILDAGWKNETSARLIVGGEAVTSALAKRMTSISHEVWNFYGPTEATVWSSCMKLSAQNCDIIYAGRPIDNVRIYVLDEKFKLVPKGVAGDIYIAGINLAYGYLSQPDLTEERFIEDPFFKNDHKMYKTGDIGKWSAAGYLVCLGRSDYQVKIRGYRIELNEIEKNLLSFESVKSCCVIAKEESLGKYLVAYLTIKGDKLNFELEQLKKHLATILPSYMIPTVFVLLDQLPLTPNGKTDRKKLESKAINVNFSHASMIPKTAVEKKLAQFVSDILHISDKFDINLNLMDLGLTSIDLIQFLFLINTEFKSNLSFLLFHQANTIKKLGAIIENNQDYIAQKKENPIILLKQLPSYKLNLFLFHPVGGTVFLYNKLCDYLTSPFNIYGIYDPGLLSRELLFNSIEEMATYYIQSIKTVQPEGPYYLAGASLGATLAFEVAQQLTQLGDQIKFVGLFDGWALYPSEIITESFLKEFIDQHYNYLKKKWSKKGDYLPPPWQTLYFQRNQLVIDYHAKMKPASFKLYLFKAKELIDVFKAFNQKFNYWDKYAQAGLVRHFVAGDHETMLQEPNVEHFAQLMDNEIKKILL